MSLESREPGILPHLQIQMGFTPLEAVQKVANMPQSEVIRRVYIVTKEGRLYPGRETLFGFINYTRDKLQLVDDDIGRIYTQGEPRTIEEEEFLKVLQLRAAATVFIWSYLSYSTIPTELRAAFSTDKEHLIGEDLSRALRGIEDWRIQNPKKNYHISLNLELQEKLERAYDRLEELLEFYNTKRPLLNVYQTPYQTWRAHDPEGEELDRLMLIGNMFRFLAPNERIREYGREISWGDRIWWKEKNKN